MVKSAGVWEVWLDGAVQALEESVLLRSLRPLVLPPSPLEEETLAPGSEVQTFEGLGPWDRAGVEVQVSHATFQSWITDCPSTGEEVVDFGSNRAQGGEYSHKLLLFSGNDYLGLAAHPAVRRAAAKAAVEFGMGPRASPLVCGYTHHHRLLESALAELKETEECLLCPTGFAANMAVLTALTSVVSIRKGSTESAVAIFSDALNHASIVDGVRVAQRQSNAEVHIYRHNDMAHLHFLLSTCKQERKVVITDSLFSMDGDFALLAELVALRKQHEFLLVIDEAHGTLVCGENGGGVAEAFGVQNEIDIHVGTLSKAIGCHGGFIACSRKWKQWIQSRGRSFIFSTALPIPVVAAAHAALMVAKKEKWRQHNVWERVQQFSEATGLHFTSPIAPIVFGNPEVTLNGSRQLLTAGFHVPAIRPPTVPLDSSRLKSKSFFEEEKEQSRLRITFTAAHTAADVEALVKALPPGIKSKGPSPNFLPTPVYWLPASLSKDVNQRSLQAANGESQDKRPGEAHVLLARAKL